MSVVHKDAMIISHHFGKGVVLVILLEIGPELEPENIGVDRLVIQFYELVFGKLSCHEFCVVMVFLKLGMPVF